MLVLIKGAGDLATGTAIRLYLPLIEPEEEDLDDDPIVDC